MIFGVHCLAVWLNEQFGDSETGGALGLVLGCWLEDAIVMLVVGPKLGSYHSKIF